MFDLGWVLGDGKSVKTVGAIGNLYPLFGAWYGTGTGHNTADRVGSHDVSRAWPIASTYVRALLLGGQAPVPTGWVQPRRDMA